MKKTVGIWTPVEGVRRGLCRWTVVMKHCFGAIVGSECSLTGQPEPRVGAVYVVCCVDSVDDGGGVWS